MGGFCQRVRRMTGIAPKTRANARRLRSELTPQERKLWAQFRDLNHRLGLNFRRQAPVGRFIVDFVDLGRKLVIEVDGGQHGSEQDEARDGWFKEQGFTVLRFWNSDVEANTEGVMQRILDHLNLQDTPPPHPSPTRGEGAATLATSRIASKPGASPPPCGEGLGVGGHPPAGPQKGPTP